MLPYSPDAEHQIDLLIVDRPLEQYELLERTAQLLLQRGLAASHSGKPNRDTPIFSGRQLIDLLCKIHGLVISPPQDIVLEGILTKSNTSHKKWAQRHCVLTPNSLQYFRNKGDEVPLGTIDLHADSLVAIADPFTKIKRKHMFCVRSTPDPRSRLWLLQATSDQECDRWIRSVKEVIDFLGKDDNNSQEEDVVEMQPLLDCPGDQVVSRLQAVELAQRLLDFRRIRLALDLPRSSKPNPSINSGGELFLDSETAFYSFIDLDDDTLDEAWGALESWRRRSAELQLARENLQESAFRSLQLSVSSQAPPVTRPSSHSLQEDPSSDDPAIITLPDPFVSVPSAPVSVIDPFISVLDPFQSISPSSSPAPPNPTRNRRNLGSLPITQSDSPAAVLPDSVPNPIPVSSVIRNPQPSSPSNSPSIPCPQCVPQHPPPLLLSPDTGGVRAVRSPSVSQDRTTHRPAPLDVNIGSEEVNIVSLAPRVQSDLDTLDTPPKLQSPSPSASEVERRWVPTTSPLPARRPQPLRRLRSNSSIGSKPIPRGFPPSSHARTAMQHSVAEAALEQVFFEGSPESRVDGKCFGGRAVLLGKLRLLPVYVILSDDAESLFVYRYSESEDALYDGSSLVKDGPPTRDVLYPIAGFRFSKDHSYTIRQFSGHLGPLLHNTHQSWLPTSQATSTVNSPISAHRRQQSWGAGSFGESAASTPLSDAPRTPGPGSFTDRTEPQYMFRHLPKAPRHYRTRSALPVGISELVEGMESTTASSRVEPTRQSKYRPDPKKSTWLPKFLAPPINECEACQALSLQLTFGDPSRVLACCLSHRPREYLCEIEIGSGEKLQLVIPFMKDHWLHALNVAGFSLKRSASRIQKMPVGAALPDWGLRSSSQSSNRSRRIQLETLSKILEVPRLRHAFETFCHRSFCVENVKFLQAFRTLLHEPIPAARAILAYRIYFSFIANDAPFRVNIDSSTTNLIVQSLSSVSLTDSDPFRQKFSALPHPKSSSQSKRASHTRSASTSKFWTLPGSFDAKSFMLSGPSQSLNVANLTPLPYSLTQHAESHLQSSNQIMAMLSTSETTFRRAAYIVFQLVRDDAYKRFLQSETFLELVGDSEEFQVGFERPRRLSFSSVPSLDDFSFLVQQCSNLTSSGLLHIHKNQNRAVHGVFVSGDWVDWLLQLGQVDSREEGVALGQRLVDAQLVSHLTNETDFADGLLHFKLHLRSGLNSDLPEAALPLLECNPKEVLSHLAGGGHSGYLLHRGVLYNRFFAVLHIPLRALLIYRSKISPRPLNILSLVNIRVSVHSLNFGKQPEAPSDDRSDKEGDASDIGPESVTGFQLSPQGLSLAASNNRSNLHSADAGISRLSSDFSGSPLDSTVFCGDPADSNRGPSPDVYYFHVEWDSGTRAMNFRVEGADDVSAWLQAFKDCSVETTLSQNSPQEAWSGFKDSAKLSKRRAQAIQNMPGHRQKFSRY